MGSGICRELKHVVPGASGQTPCPAERHRWFIKAGTCNASRRGGAEVRHGEKKKEGGEETR